MQRFLVSITILMLIFNASHQRLEAKGQSDSVLRQVRLPVLMYHYIDYPPPDADTYRLDLTVTPDNFREQMQWLRDHNFEPVSPDDLELAMTRGRKLPERAILLTFDDGYENAYTDAYRILREFGFKGTFFVVTDWMDEGKSGYLTWKQAEEMALNGMSIQNHSRRHYDMRKRDGAWLVYEILGPIQTIEAHTGVRPQFFCYPGGQFDQNVVDELRSAGVMGAFTTNDGTFNYSDNMLRLPRVRIRGSTSLTAFADLVTWER
jgi:peptidoglycan/xylan/chitin deacetylase (PgdA/CDA1 family)